VHNVFVGDVIMTPQAFVNELSGCRSSPVWDRVTKGQTRVLHKDGLELCLSEKWDGFVLDMESFYHCFPKDPQESEDEFVLRRMAMMTTVSNLRAMGQGKALASVYRYKLPFRVDPDEKRVTYIAAANSRVVHIDLAERKRIDYNFWQKVNPTKLKINTPKPEYSQIVD
jgi:hypothetical protein